MSFYRRGLEVERDVVPSKVREFGETVGTLFKGSRFMYREGTSDRKGLGIIARVIAELVF